jgi:hypothetical protein
VSEGSLLVSFLLRDTTMSRNLLGSYRVNRKNLVVTTLDAVGNDVAYWRAQSVAARLRAMELMRQINYGHAATSGRLKRVLEVAQLETR